MSALNDAREWLQSIADTAELIFGEEAPPVTFTQLKAFAAVMGDDARRGLAAIAVDAAGGEPAKVIVVTEANGRVCRYRADDWDASGWLTVRRKVSDGAGAADHRNVAEYAAGAWLSVREDGAEVPDAAARALAIAKAALAEIGKRGDDDGYQLFGHEIAALASDALNEIWNEVEG